MKFKLYYHTERDCLGVNTRDNLLQFSEEANFFYVLTGEWVFICEIEFDDNVYEQIKGDEAGKIPVATLPNPQPQEIDLGIYADSV